MLRRWQSPGRQIVRFQLRARLGEFEADPAQAPAARNRAAEMRDPLPAPYLEVELNAKSNALKTIKSSRNNHSNRKASVYEEG